MNRAENKGLASSSYNTSIAMPEGGGVEGGPEQGPRAECTRHHPGPPSWCGRAGLVVPSSVQRGIRTQIEISRLGGPSTRTQVKNLI
jgi:hypothetical protein